MAWSLRRLHLTRLLIPHSPCWPLSGAVENWTWNPCLDDKLHRAIDRHEDWRCDMAVCNRANTALRPEQTSRIALPCYEPRSQRCSVQSADVFHRQCPRFVPGAFRGARQATLRLSPHTNAAPSCQVRVRPWIGPAFSSGLLSARFGRREWRVWLRRDCASV